MWPLLLLAICTICHAPCIVNAEPLPGLFKTEPAFTPEIFEFKKETSNRSLLAPGYIFVDPLVRSWGYGPQIYKDNGELVWYGNGTAHNRVQDLKPCEFLGQPNHLCWHETETRKVHSPVGRKVVYDNTFTQVGKNYTQAGNDSYPNGHEFNMLPGGESFLEALYEPKRMDLSLYSGPKDGWVYDGCFVEIDTRTGNRRFQWCFLDHRPIWETQMFLNGHDQKNQSSTAAGRGTFDKPWDFFHINAIDKNAEGDYLASSRFLDQILKIAGPDNVHGVEPGTILWRLGGNGNDFKMSFNFSRQHAVRYVSTRATETVLSLFSNHWDFYTPASATYSEGQLIHINNATKKAYLVKSFPHPTGEKVGAQGNMQVLPNGNALIGWGVRNEVTEYSPTAEVLLHIDMGRNSYRAFKYPWFSNPQYPPKLLPYMKTCSSSLPAAPLQLYVSWNGATNVTHWRFHASAESELGPWIPLGTFPKDGFETHVEILTHGRSWRSLLLPFPKLVAVEALDSNGVVIGQATAETFVPLPETIGKHRCGFVQCAKPRDFGYKPSQSCAGQCGSRPWISALLGAIVLCLAIEIMDAMMQRSCRRDRATSFCNDAAVSEDMADEKQSFSDAESVP